MNLKNDLTEGSIGSKIINFTLPLLLGNFFQQAYNVVDSIVVGRFIGKQALAAVGINFPILFLMVSLIMGIALGISIIISQYFGAKQTQNIRIAVDTAYIVLIFSALIVTAIGLIFGKYILLLIKTPEDIFPSALIYLKIIFIGMFFTFGYNGLSALLRGIGDSRTPTVLLVIATIINIILDLIFVIYFKMGISGVAIATVISQAISFIVGIAISLKKKLPIAPRIKGITFSFDIFIKSVNLGIPTGVQQVLVSLGFMALTRIVNGFGTNAIAAFTAAGRIDTFASMPIMSFGMAITTFVAQNMGANRIDRVKEGVKKTFIYSASISTFLGLLIIIFSKYLLLIFTKDQQVQKIGQDYIRIVASFYFFFSVMFTFNGALRGAGDTIVPMFNTLIALWILRVPISYLLSRKFGTSGIWWGIPIAWFFGAILAFYYYKKGNWQKKKIIQNT
ncbi:MAG: MATE family efflux transporter [Spirochaetales bacterium]|jgi:putative MATE family efflux protein|nr:MATE family efflux transporter [Exilispira sp.]NMC68344.1 MATE family efflux transporter [Spirochaetales bacterium]